MLQGHGDDTYQYPDIRMNFSSNIYAHAEMAELKAHLCSHIHLIDNYPEPSAQSVERLIARKYGLHPHSVLVTNGATEAIYLVAQTLASACRTFSTGSEPTFSEYEDASSLYGLRRLPELDSPESDTLLWLCNPNNPTGTATDPAQIANLARRYAYVVVDQSYEDLTMAPMLSHAHAAGSENIIQIHSLTKTYAIPGLRIGYIVAPPTIVGAIRRFARPWSVNAMAIEAARWLISHELRAVPDLRAYLDATQQLRRQLEGIPGITTMPTHTNFILARVETITAAQLKEQLAQHHHILIRDASNFRGLSPHHFRVSTQSPEENQLLVEAIRATIG